MRYPSIDEARVGLAAIGYKPIQSSSATGPQQSTLLMEQEKTALREHQMKVSKELEAKRKALPMEPLRYTLVTAEDEHPLVAGGHGNGISVRPRDRDCMRTAAQPSQWSVLLPDSSSNVLINGTSSRAPCPIWLNQAIADGEAQLGPMH